MASRATGGRAGERASTTAIAARVTLALLLAVSGVGIGPAGTAASAAPTGGGTTDEVAPAAGEIEAAEFDGGTAAETDRLALQQEPPVEESIQEEIDPDSVRLTVSVSENGTAHWRLEYWTRLETDNDTAAFEELRDDVAANSDEYVARFAERTNETVAAAENATGREMTATGFTASAQKRSIPEEYGVLTYTFEWRGFAVVDGDRIEIGDAIDRFYLSDRTRLAVAWPSTHRLVDATPAPDDQRDSAVLWRGTRTDFVSGEPRVIVEREESGGDSDVGGDEGSSLLWLGGAAVAALAIAGVAVLRRTSRGGDDTGPAAGAPDEDADDGGADQAPPRSDSGTTPGSASGPREADRNDDGDPPAELLSNEERVLRLLEANGGRMRQQEVVAETGWTEAKTSQVVGEMREDGTIETFRLGRENVLKLPDEDGRTTV